ncbi:signal protein [Idiomarina xiamenensis 10-D-4]|uniref:diguanylate cyclase n=2 Tax=Idiomarina xiamenensis TaxID=1207041 RepID=K2L3N3_9GAMM|nr:signal protein [Idiomarina xiamenensis 10-D-4]
MGLFTLCVSGVALASSQGHPQWPLLSYQTSGEQWQIEDAIQAPPESWQSHPQQRVSFGYTQAVYWFRFDLPASQHARVVNIEYPLLDHVDAFFVRNEQVIKHVQVGDKYPFDEREVALQDFVIAVAAAPKQQVYLRVQTTSSLRLPVTVWRLDDYVEARTQADTLSGMYYGLLFCMAVYNLFGFLAAREAGFLSYTGYTIFMGLLMATLDGSGFRYWWPNSVWLQDHAIVLFGSITFFFAAVFTRHLLQVPRYSQRLNRVLSLFQLATVLVFLSGLLLPYNQAIHVLLGFAIIGSVTLLAIGIYLWRQGLMYARIYVLAWGVLLAAIVANSLAYLGILDSGFIQRNAIMMGSAIEVLLLSWVLAVRYTHERNAKLAAQAEALRQAEATQQTQTLLNEQLEENVAERTFELQIALRELQDANNELEQKNREDSLTGLYNRRHFDRQLDVEFRRNYRQNSALSLIMLDVDHFKEINDQYGHIAGDDVLVSLAELLRTRFKRGSDIVARYGGEEFVVILPATDIEGAMVVAEDLQQRIRQQVFKVNQKQPITLTVSMGVAEVKGGAYKTAVQLLKAADEMLYQAKHAGRDKIIAEASPALLLPQQPPPS